MSPLTQGLNYRSACDVHRRFTQHLYNNLKENILNDPTLPQLFFFKTLPSYRNVVKRLESVHTYAALGCAALRWY